MEKLKGFAAGSVIRRFVPWLAGIALVASAASCKTPQTITQAQTDSAIHLKKITFLAEQRGTVMRIYTSRKAEYTSYKLAEPLRLAVEIPNVVLDFEPRRMPVENDLVSAISVVRFTKVNSVRVELDLFSDVQFKMSQKQDYLEVLLTGAGGAVAQSARKEITAGKGETVEPETRENGRERLDALAAEVERLKSENLEGKKALARYEEENSGLRKQNEESRKQLDEANSLSQTLRARASFVEGKLSELEARIGEGKPALPAAPQTVADTPAAPPSVQAPDSHEMERELNSRISGWLSAWNGKRYDAFAGYYAKAFKSKNMGLAEWLEDKKAKFSNRKPIKVVAKKMKITQNGDGTATVLFEQTYRAGSYRDKGLKQLIWSNHDGQWLITSEEWSPLK